MSNKIRLLIAGSIALLGFIIVMLLVINDLTLDFDKSITHFFVDVRGNKGNALYYIARILTEFGDVIGLFFIFLALAIYYRFDTRFVYLLVSFLVVMLINTILKNLIARPRPNLAYMWTKEDSDSFPSGHSAGSMMFYLSFILINVKFETNQIIKKIFIGISCAFIIIIPITRLILSVHYFTDVLGGMLLGASGAIFGLLIGYPIIDKIYTNTYNKVYNYICNKFKKKAE